MLTRMVKNLGRELPEVGRDTDQFALLLPDGIGSRIRKVAEQNRRSMNAETICRLAIDILDENGAAEAGTSPRREPPPTMEGKGNDCKHD